MPRGRERLPSGRNAGKWAEWPAATGLRAGFDPRACPAGDIIKASIKGRTGIWGEVTEIKEGRALIPPALPRDRVAARERQRDCGRLSIVDRDVRRAPFSRTREAGACERLTFCDL